MSEFTCPHCGRLISAVKHETAYGVPWRPMRTLADSAHRFGETAQVASDYTEATRDTPARAPSKEADVSVPFWKTIITGVFFGIPASIGIGIGTKNVKFGQDILWGLVITGGTVAASWLIFLYRSDKSLWIREKIINQDIDKDGHIGKPPTMRMEIEDHQDGRDREVWVDLPLPRQGYAGLIAFARSVALGGDSFSERTATDHGYGRPAWQELRDIFLDNGWAEWNHPNEERQGVSLLRPGKVILLRLAREGVPREQWVND